MKLIKMLVCIPLISVSALACADNLTLDSAIGGGIGGALGGAAGAELGGREGAIVGSAAGAAIGTTLNTQDGHYEKQTRHHRTVELEPVIRYRAAPTSRFCPPGQAKKGRC